MIDIELPKKFINSDSVA